MAAAGTLTTVAATTLAIPSAAAAIGVIALSLLAASLVRRIGVEAQADQFDQAMHLPQTLGTSVRMPLSDGLPVHAAADRVPISMPVVSAGWWLRQSAKATTALLLLTMTVAVERPTMFKRLAHAVLPETTANAYAAVPAELTASSVPQLTPSRTRASQADDRPRNATTDGDYGSGVSGASEGAGDRADANEAADYVQRRPRPPRMLDASGERAGAGSGEAASAGAGDTAGGGVAAAERSPVAAAGRSASTSSLETVVSNLPRRYRSIARVYFGVVR